MKKELVSAQEKFYKDCNIDLRTLPMIISHYLSIGEQAAACLSDEKIERIYEQSLEEQTLAEESGQIMIITPDFQKYVLKACQQLYKLPIAARYDIIKKNLK